MMPRTRLPLLVLAPLAIAAALAFSACGGDEEETIPLADWVMQADEICQEADAGLEQEITDFFGGEVPNQPDPDQLSEMATEVFVPNFQNQHDAIAELPPPDEQADTVDDTLNALQEGIDQLAGDPSQITTEEGPAGFEEASRLAGELGLEECGQQ